MNISKKLIKAVMKEKLSETYVTILTNPYLDGNELIFACRSGCGTEGVNQTINIYEFMCKCKDWAYKQNILLISYSHNGFSVAKLSNSRTGDRISDSLFSTDSEPESVFKACEWIMKRKELK